MLGFQDETWWTRLAQPDVRAWAGEEPLRLLPNERDGAKEALACYGLLRADTGAMRLRFVEGRPVSQVTEDFLGWLCGLFAAEGLACLQQKPKTPRTIHSTWPRDRDDDLRALLHQSPRTLGKPTSLWTLPLAAQVCFENGWTPRRVSGETVRRVLKRLGVGWKRAKHWLVSPDPEYARKKKCATG